MASFKITIHIADRPYRLNVSDEHEEELFRSAAHFIEEQSKKYATNFAFRDKQDLLAMVALHYTTEALKKDSELNNSLDQFAEKLSSINQRLEEHK